LDRISKLFLRGASIEMILTGFHPDRDPIVRWSGASAIASARR